MRCFIGIDLSVDATKEIERLQRIIKPHFVGKTTSSENLHLTLKFLGEIEDNTLNEIKRDYPQLNITRLSWLWKALEFFLKKLSKSFW